VRAVDAGYKEVALTGVHLGGWGRDLGGGHTLSDLLAALAAVPGEVRVRVSSLEPMDCTPDVLGWLVKRPDRFAPHLHLPLQHASDRMLQAMRRPYSGAAYARLVNDVRASVPHAAIGSDVIVGFPGETDKDAELLSGYLESSPLTHLHVFPYSDRPGTAAERLPGKVHGAVVKARAQRLRAVSRVLSDRFRAAQAGTIRPALTIDDGTMAVTDNYFKVPVPDGRVRNEWVQVAIPPADSMPPL
jgi:threonylcarbamoyladenosine tRNA methylthiotransferase MtaB